MKDFKGTKGPWKVLNAEQPVSNYSYTISSSSGCVGYWKGHKDWHEDSNWLLGEGDANLIAAAPELLEALQRMVESYEFEASMDNPLLLAAKSAIAKALGESK